MVFGEDGGHHVSLAGEMSMGRVSCPRVPIWSSSP